MSQAPAAGKEGKKLDRQAKQRRKQRKRPRRPGERDALLRFEKSPRRLKIQRLESERTSQSTKNVGRKRPVALINPQRFSSTRQHHSAPNADIVSPRLGSRPSFGEQARYHSIANSETLPLGGDSEKHNGPPTTCCSEGKWWVGLLTPKLGCTRGYVAWVGSQ